MKQSLLLMNGGTIEVLEEVQDYSAKLSAIVENYRRGIWIKPDHQRDFVWDTAKVKAWIDRLSLATQDRARKPVGVIVTYQIDDGKPSPIFINDGSQRIRATMQALDEPETFGYDKEKATAIVNAITIQVQHRHYQTQDDALEDFQLLNMGTSLTPYEMCKGILTNHESFKTSWEPMFDSVHALMKTVGGGFVSMPSTPERRQKHKFTRHDFLLMARWLSKAGLADHRNVAANELRKEQIDKGTVIESELRHVCERMSTEILRQEIARLCGHIQRQSALYRDIWSRTREAEGKAISATLFRWLLEISIWATQTAVSVSEWEQFVEKLMVHTQGTAVVQDITDIRNRTTLGLGNVGHLKAVCSIIGSPMYAGKPPRRRRERNILPGYDQSHLDPFVTHGNGPTILEPAPRNRARGAKPIDEDVDA